MLYNLLLLLYEDEAAARAGAADRSAEPLIRLVIHLVSGVRIDVVALAVERDQIALLAVAMTGRIAPVNGSASCDSLLVGIRFGSAHQQPGAAAADCIIYSRISDCV